MVGTTLQNRYHLEAELGRGAMGVVYRAHDTLLNRAVAVKLLYTTGLGTTGKARLLAEARAAAKLNHPNIVTVHDAGEVDDNPFIVMELVAGESLHHFQPGSLDDTLHISRQICLALEHAHAHGIIHRDLKPDNVVRTPEGTAKLMDFGLARTAGAPRLTEEGAIVGTFAYMAPELIQGQAATVQSDLYALGIMLYEWLIGQPPFTGENLMALMMQHLHEPVTPPSQHQPAVPAALDLLVVQLLSKEPEQRPSSAAAVRVAIDSLSGAADKGVMTWFTAQQYRLSLHLLGLLALHTADNHPLPDLRRKTRALLAYLAVAQRPYTRHQLATLFCQEADIPLRALRHLLSRLRTAVGSDALLEDGDMVQLDTSHIWVDAIHFTQALETDPGQLPDAILAEAIALYHGDFLSGLYLPDAPEFELWLLGYRAHLHRLYERGALVLLDHYQAQAKFEKALFLAQQLLQYNPLLEEAHYRLVSLYAQTGQRMAALNQYERCRQLLADELAVEPMPALVTLYTELLAGRFKPPPAAHPAPLQKPNWSTAADFVGREDELAQLHMAWAAAQQGQTAIVLVTAEAGGGKTRLVQEFIATQPLTLSLVGQCYESTRALAYQPLTQLLERFIAQLDEKRWQVLSGHWLDELARLLPTVAAKRPSATPTGKPEQLLMAVVALLHLAEGPLLLFLDDLQWADAASLQLLHYISERLTVPVLLVGAYRSEEAEDNPALLTLLRDWSRREQMTHLILPPLSATAIEQLLAQLWPQLPAGYRIPHLRDRLHQATQGNPLFISEIVRELTGSTQLPDDLPVPPSLRDLIQRRLGQLPGSGRQVLESLAVLEKPASLDLAQQISARSEEEMLQALELGLRWRLLQVDATLNQLEFSHDLMRQAVGQSLSPVRRQVLHRRTAVALSQHGAQAATLVHHWHLAGDREQEGIYAVKAGEEATAVYANQEAIHYFERALELLPESTRQLEVMCNLADVWMLTGKWLEAEAFYLQALSTAEKLADLRFQARCQTAIGRLLARRSQYHEALDWLEQARLSHTSLGDLKAAAQNVGTIGIVYWQLDEHDQALACYEHALQVDREFGDQASVVLWLGNIANVHHQRGEYPKALDGYKQTLEICMAAGRKVETGIILGNLGNTYREMGEYQQAMTCYEQALQYRQEVGDEAGMTYAVSNLGTLNARMGVFPSALACFQWVLQMDLQLGQLQNVADDLGQLAEVFLSEKSYEWAQTLLDRSIPLLRKLRGKYGLCHQLVMQTAVFIQYGQYRQAQLCCQEAKIIAKGLRQDSYFSACLFSIRLDVALEQTAVNEAIETLKSLLPEAIEGKEQAAILYEIWLFDQTQEDVRQETAVLYQTLYTHTPNILYRQRFQELTGQTLPTPPPLPDLPAIVTGNLVDLETLLIQFDQLE